jgi:hypothetical protein
LADDPTLDQLKAGNLACGYSNWRPIAYGMYSSCMQVLHFDPKIEKLSFLFLPNHWLPITRLLGEDGTDAGDSVSEIRPFMKNDV